MSKKNKLYFQDALSDILADIGDLLIRKNLDYGPLNIDRFGLQGITIRMNDKIERLINLVQLKKEPEVEESITDTLVDLAGYAILGLMLEQHGKILPLKQKSDVQ